MERMPKETKRALERMVDSVRRAVMLTEARVDPAFAMAVVLTDMVDTLREMGYPEESIRGLRMRKLLDVALEVFTFVVWVVLVCKVLLTALEVAR